MKLTKLFPWLFGKHEEQVPEPQTSDANPGVGTEARFDFSNGERRWTEEVNVVHLAARTLDRFGYAMTDHGSWLEHPESGIIIQPLLADAQVLEAGGVRTVTTVETSHPVLVPDGVFEYQHGAGDTVAESILTGFDQCVQLDFVTLLDALLDEPETCSTLNMTFPTQDSKPALQRRAVLGPTAQYMQQPPEAADSDCGCADEEEHPFCPCCLLTRSIDAFRSLIQDEGFYGIRMFAARGEDGTPEADCRVNGEDWEDGERELCKYAATWPDAGYEFRKQYVVLHSYAGRRPNGDT
jgi:hypothetical protein